MNLLTMKYYRLILGALSVLSVLSCQQNNIEDVEVNGLKQYDLFFAYGSECGWGTIDDSLAVTEDYIFYDYYSQFYQEEFQITTTLNQQDWHELKDTFNVLTWSRFKLIDLNTCNICVDGCDYLLFVKYNNQTHRIRYGEGDLEKYPEIKALADMLMEIKTQQYESGK